MSIVTTIPLGEWQREMERRGKLDCGFVCPACGNVATPNDFRRRDADFQRAPQECIGRLALERVLDPTKLTNHPLVPWAPLPDCTWAAFGLIDICTVHLDIARSKPVPVFAFAEVKP